MNGMFCFRSGFLSIGAFAACLTGLTSAVATSSLGPAGLAFLRADWYHTLLKQIIGKGMSSGQFNICNYFIIILFSEYGVALL